MKLYTILSIIAAYAATAEAFRGQSLFGVRGGLGRSTARLPTPNALQVHQGGKDVIGQCAISNSAEGKDSSEAMTIADSVSDNNALTVAVMALAVWLMPMQAAVAGGGEYGILTGRTASMLHPVTMLLLFGTSVYSGYLGLQWRRLRGLSTEITDLQKQAPRLSTGQVATFPLSSSISTLEGQIRSVEDASQKQTLIRDLELLRSSSELDAKIEELKATRKQLQGADLKEKHHQTGSILLSAGVTVSLLGAFNTYMRAGKLFPGPHLYAGMGCTILWACAAALVPAMQKGNEAARAGHIGLNVINVGLFGWQVVTGLDIMFKVWEKTSWP